MMKEQKMKTKNKIKFNNLPQFFSNFRDVFSRIWCMLISLVVSECWSQVNVHPSLKLLMVFSKLKCYYSSSKLKCCWSSKWEYCCSSSSIEVTASLFLSTQLHASSIRALTFHWIPLKTPCLIKTYYNSPMENFDYPLIPFKQLHLKMKN